jgi:Uma2 family endonuclease
LASIITPKVTKIEIYWNCYRNTLQTGDRQMVQAPQKNITLDEFLQLPETTPASEYINGAILQKPMPKGKHSKLQGRLVTVVNDIVEKPQNSPGRIFVLFCCILENSKRRQGVWMNSWRLNYRTAREIKTATSPTQTC